MRLETKKQLAPPVDSQPSEHRSTVLFILQTTLRLISRIDMQPDVKQRSPGKLGKLVEAITIHDAFHLTSGPSRCCLKDSRKGGCFRSLGGNEGRAVCVNSQRVGSDFVTGMII